MAGSVSEERWNHIRGVSVTTISAIAGVAAGMAAAHLAAGPDDTLGVIILAIAVVAQFPLIRFSGLKPDLGAKDYLFITFITFCFWFVTWAIMMTTGAELPV